MTQEQDNGYRIQPDKFIPDTKDPFANDLMGRKPQADALVKLATSVSGPAVIAVDAPYGVGKSTFLSMFALSPELKNAADVIVHNAWETEFSDMSFNSLAKDVMESAQPSDAKQSFKESALPITRTTLPIIGKIASLFESDIAEFIAVASTATNVAEPLTQKVSDAIANLKTTHQKPNERASQKRIVIIIDELDRCTPDYAIETLEAIHHIFASNEITFVLGLHRQQLMESIKAIYGQGFNAEGYLDRFIDLTVPLRASRDNFIKAKLNQRVIAGGISYRPDYAQQLLTAMPNINARSIDRFAKNLIAVTNVMPSHMVRDTLAFESAYITACTALAVKIQSPSIYRDFNENRAPDKNLYDLLGASQFPFERETSAVAAILIAAQVDIKLAVSSLSEAERRQQTSEILSGISEFNAPRQQSESDKDTLNKATEILTTHSPLYALLREQFSSTHNNLIGYGLSWATTRELSYPDRKLSYWQEVTNIIDLTT